MYQCGKSRWQLKSLLPRTYGCISWAVCEFFRSGSSHSSTVQRRMGAMQQGARGQVPATASHAVALDPYSWPTLEALPFCKAPLPRGGPAFSSSTSSHGIFASHPLARRKPGLCQAEEEFLAHPSSSSPEPLCWNLPRRSAISWVGGSRCSWWFSRWHCSPRDECKVQLPTREEHPAALVLLRVWQKSRGLASCSY